ncbi:MAG: hypothetical protein COX62_08155 [Deltaproteobacteria bacterium CG_4_10_14_0_2_um_filter_43_8]|nr:MAG: hypothetical protein COV43_07615 [Deltaproteobacteria bacterium CG11_big_fil_rev_8_21_14_0_20_42_23]PJA18799.1 MAG: hypothetical protein COX62_08155 [Deltaproteobacteria bacterium CG_4_10_14_0_2_um_filter_43_8]PJC63330.1 MAG: hypothetical protein CO021_09980 [Deltaproteobacteria bacterium CG_4_9_14_0_2_um_filter_42_21]
MLSLFRQHFLLLGFILSAFLHLLFFISFPSSKDIISFRPLNINLVQTAEEKKNIQQEKNASEQEQRLDVSGFNKSDALSEQRSSEQQVAGNDLAESALYQERILALLDKAKRYPLLSKQRGEEGGTVMEVTLSREGEILVSRLKKSSGVYLLDEEAKALVKRVGSFPPFPKSIQEDQYIFSFPIEFSLE